MNQAGPTDPPAGSPADAAPTWRIRVAEPADAVEIERLVRELATYEREPAAVVATAADVAAALSADPPLVHALLAEVGGRAVGMAVWFVTFSTWRGRHGIWLEDLFVSPEHRGLGLGRELLARLAAVAVERGYQRLEWNVLDWNVSALEFYRRLGAQPLDTWTVHRLDGPSLAALAARVTGGKDRRDDNDLRSSDREG
jgi:GNAT superfamily N-acetyltransferase